ncbi:MAG: hypothetical protein U9N12_00740 [Euryarchaeota archaeon]|nr:hypothetical protein [Euryarchaeota archaeon]
MVGLNTYRKLKAQLASLEERKVELMDILDEWGGNKGISITDLQCNIGVGYFGLSGNSRMRALFHFSGGSGQGKDD